MRQDLTASEIMCVAQAAHEVNRAWQRAVGDPIDPPFESLTNEQLNTIKMSIIGVVVNDFNAEATHAAWVAEKKAQGWTHGDRKDVSKRVHPCLVSWAELPSEQRVKDELWVETIRNFVKNFWRLPQ